MEGLEYTNVFAEQYQTLLRWFETEVLVVTHLIAAGAALSSLIVARLLGPGLARRIKARKLNETGAQVTRNGLAMLALLATPIVWLLLMWMMILVARQAGWPDHLLQIVASLTSAWVVIRMASTLIRDPMWARFISITAWTLAALSTLGLFEATVELLDSIALTLGSTRVTLLMVVKGVLSLVILMWVAFAASGVLESRISRAPNLTPSVQVLFGKIAKIVLVTMAFLIAVDTVGIDLSALTVFGGALGVGIGFGLQKIIANLVSGVILLVDKSIKPGDVITVGTTFGWIETLGARYASVRTRDGIEHLIPNEDLIVQRVENWSHTDNWVRLRIPIGISYSSDVREAQALCLASAGAVPRVLKHPEPRCLLKGFGDSSVDFELRIWIDDPTNGRSNVISDVLLHVWDRFHEHGIEIPFPQRDLHIKDATTLRIAHDGSDPDGASPG